MAKKIPLVIFLIITGLFFCLFSYTQAQTVSFSPASLEIGKDTSFSLTLSINAVSNLFGVALDLNFNPSLISYLSTIEGNFLSQGCQTSLMTAQNPQGKLIFGLTRLGASCGGVSGQGTLATINFKSLTQEGTSNLSFSNNSLCLLSGASCNYVTGTWNGAAVTVKTSQPSDTTPPSVPTNLTATTISSSQINQSWTASTDNVGVTGYRIYRCQGAGCTPSAQIATSVTNSYSDSGLSPSTTYIYRVAAYDAAGNVSGQSSSASATTQAAADTTPPVISGISVSSLTYNSATINWTTNESATSQVLYGLTTSYGSQTTEDSNLVTSHSVLLSNLSPSTPYHFRTVSKDAAGNTSAPNDSTFTTQATPTLNVSLSANPSSGEMPLSGVDLTATVSGSITGNINYTFYCNRSDSGINITIPYQAKYDNQAVTTKTATDICNYTNSGTYTAKVIAERGSYQAESRITITVLTPSPSPSPSSGPGGGGGVATSPSPAPTSSISPSPGPSTSPSPSPSSSPAPSAGVPPNGMLLKTADSDKIYLIVNNQKRWITDPAVFASYGLTPGSQKTVTQAELDQYQSGANINKISLPEGSLIRAIEDFKVYIIKPPYKRHIFNPAIFNMYQHFSWNSIKDVDKDIVDSYITSDLYRANSDYRVYSLEEVNEILGKAIKHHLNVTAQRFSELSYSWNQIFIVNTEERDYYETGSDLK